VAGNDGSQHSDGEILDLTDEQLAAVDRIREILDTLPPDRRRVFQEHLKDLTDGEEDSGEERSSEETSNKETERGCECDDA
jgi:hypothetical protein